GTGPAGTGKSTGAASSQSQQVDGLGRPLTGDKGKCAPGGLLQENITFTAPPCMPAFAGANGGNTYAGVTADTINVVVIIPSYGETDKALAATGLAETPEQAQEDANTYAAFFNKHYELYGRKLKIISEPYVE